jgi:HEAT repeat protein
VVGEPDLSPAVRNALGAPSPELRRAAAWVLGELPTDAAATAALAAARDDDPDEIVRRLASKAYSKQTGRIPRALRNVGDAAFSDRGVAG